jgi:hypothetical protein
MENKESIKFEKRLVLVKRNIDKLPLLILRLFCQYLCWIDVASLRLSSKELFKVPQPKITPIVAAYIRELFPGDTDFIPALIRSGAAISGGFLLRCLYSIPPSSIGLSGWDMKDIDVYIKNDHSDKNDVYNWKFLRDWNPSDNISTAMYPKNSNFKHREYGKYLINELFATIELEKMETMSQRIRRNESSPIDLIDVIQFDYGDEEHIKIDYINIRHDYNGSIIDYVNLAFDISVCKNVYDGKQLYISNLSHLIDKCFEYNSQANVFGMSSYGTKDNDYEKHCKGSLDSKRLEKYMKDRAKIRLKKYEDRGFKCIGEKINTKYEPIDKSIFKNAFYCNRCTKHNVWSLINSIFSSYV